MKRWIGLALLVFVGAAGWRIGGALTPDALSMAVGLLFGVLAGVPVALLVTAANRRHHVVDCTQATFPREQPGHLMPIRELGAPYAQQPPIIVIAGPQGLDAVPQAAQSNTNWLSQEPAPRHFTVVGDREDLVEDW